NASGEGVGGLGSETGGNGAVGTGASAGTGGAPVAPDASPYFESGAWHGYAYVYSQGAGTTMTPMDLHGVENLPYCVRGEVGPMPDYSGLALIGVNLNEPRDGSSRGTIVPTADGVEVSVTNTVGSSLRVQVEGPLGSDD